MKTLFIIFLLLSVITLGFSIFATVGQVNLSRKFTGKTTGTVSHWDYDDDMFSLHIWFPVIKFTVNGTEYKTNIPFTRVKTIKDPKMYPGQFTASGKLKPIFYHCSGLDHDEFYEKYKRGTQVDVFYDPNDPDTSYAVRSARDPFLVLQWGITVFNIAMTFLFHYLWLK